MNANHGFTVIETLIAVFLLGVATIAIVGLATLGVRMSLESERENVATALLNEQLENVRSLAYKDVGLEDAAGIEPDGILRREEIITSGQQEFTVKTSIELKDDPGNGPLPATPGALNEATADYKEIRMEIRWVASNGNIKTASATTRVSPSKSQKCEALAPASCPGMVSPGEGACIPRVACPDSGQCPPTQQVVPSCPQGAQFCPACYTDSDCTVSGQTCDEATKTCVALPAGQCDSNADCTSPQVCQGGSCTAPCDTNPCTAPSVCNTTTNVCTEPCTSGTCDCPSGTYCDTDSQLCVNGPAPPSPPTPTPCPAGRTSGLIGHWALDDGKGGTVSDWSANDNDGVTVNGTAWTTDRPSQVTFSDAGDAQFDGDNDYITIPDFASLLDRTQGTISLWVRMMNGIQADGQQRGIFGVGSGSNDNNFVQLLKTSANALALRYRVDDTNYDSQKADLTSGFDNTWAHVAGVWNTDRSVKLYTNGNLAETEATRSGDIGAGSLNQTRIGSNADGASNDSFNGRIDEVRVYNRALSETEINELADGKYCEIPNVSPTLTQKDPADNATEVPIDKGITMSFSELVWPGTGTISIIGGPSTITINAGNVTGLPASLVSLGSQSLKYSTDYHIEITGDAFRDDEQAWFAGITNSDDWNFSTGSMPACSNPQFAEHQFTIPINRGAAVRTGDLDGDGDYDIVVAGFNDKVSWFRNTDGFGNFSNTPINIETYPCSDQVVEIADIDGDRDADVVTNKRYGPTGAICLLTWYENNGTGNFVPKWSIGEGSLDAHAIDVDGLNGIDIVSAGSAKLLKNNGNGTFSSVNLPADDGESIHAADYDRDGDIDIVNEIYGSNISWNVNDGAGSFPYYRLTQMQGGQSDLASADMDGDGDIDIIGVGKSRAWLSWTANNGSGGFAQQYNIFGSQYSPSVGVIRQINVVDIDRDGDMDVATGGVEAGIGWQENEGNGVFTPHQLSNVLYRYNPAYYKHGIDVADLDQDGDADIIGTWYDTLYTTSKVYWYEQTCP